MYPSNINGNDYAYSSFSCSTSGDINQPPPPPPPSYGNNRGFLYYNNIGAGTDLNPSNLDTKLDEESPLSSFSSFLTQYSPNVHLEDDAILRQHLHDLILHQQQPPTSPPSHPPINHDQTIHDLAAADDDDYTEKNSSYTTTVLVQEHFPPRKRSSKKDRHSKIETALGPRDRRMRLSLDVARSFFGLQDILGFDKASKTVEWLLNKSKTAIKELKRGLSHDQLKKHSCSFISASSTSESCEVLSGMDECAARINDENRSLNSNSCSPCRNEEGEEEEDKKKMKKKSKRKEAFGRGLLRRTTPHHPLAKETRERARARARERTIQKRINNIGSPAKTSNSTGDQLRSKLWNPFEVQIMGQSANQTHEEPGSSSIQLKNGGMSNIVGDSSLVAGNWIPAPIFFNYQQNSGPSQEHHQFTDFECFGKPWEGINN